MDLMDMYKVEMSEIQNITDSTVDVKEEQHLEREGRNLLGLLPICLLAVIMFLRVSWTMYRSMGQKTRSPQQRRMYVGSRQRQSLTPQEPTIYVSPSNLPPPPKYELMAPPSYDEVVGIHGSNYAVQPISQPINAALAQSSSISRTESNGTSSIPTLTTINENEPSVTVETRRPSITVSR